MTSGTFILRNIVRNSRRSVCTAFTLGLAACILAVLLSVPNSMDRIVAGASRTLRIVVNNRTGVWYRLPVRYCDEIEKIPGVAACTAITGFPASYRDDDEPIGALAMTSHSPAVFPDYHYTDDTLRMIRTDRRAATVGATLMRRYHWKAGQLVDLRGPGNLKLEFLIAGEIPSRKYPNVFVFQHAYLEEAYRATGRDDGDLAWFLEAKVASAQQLPDIIKKIDNSFRNSDYETRTSTESDALQNGLTAVAEIRPIVHVLCTAIVLTVLLIAANSSAMSVRERHSELAIIRSLGFGRVALGLWVFGECAIIGLIGGTLGAATAILLLGRGIVMGAVLGGTAGVLSVTPAVAVASAVAAIGINLLSGLLPLGAAFRGAPALAIRRDG